MIYCKKEMEDEFMVKDLIIRIYMGLINIPTSLYIIFGVMAPIVIFGFYLYFAFVHEMCHASKIRMYGGEDIDVNIEINHEAGKGFLSMVTKSNYLRTLAENKEKEDVQEIIREIAIAGIHGEKKACCAILVLAVLAFGIALYVGYIAIWAYMFICSMVAYLLAAVYRKGSSDMKYYRNPTAFIYKY